MAFSNSDHLLIYAERYDQVNGSSKFTQVRYFRNYDVDAFISDLQQVAWHTMDVFSSVDDKWSCWKSLFISVIDTHCPLHSVRLRKHSLRWINGKILKLMRACNYYQTKFRQAKSLLDHEKFKSLKKRVTRELRNAKSTYFATLSQIVSSNPKKAWNLLNSANRPKCKSHTGSIHTSAGGFTSPSDIVNLFKDHFPLYLILYPPLLFQIMVLRHHVPFILPLLWLMMFWMFCYH